jgi:hypothetical protein
MSSANSTHTSRTAGSTAHDHGQRGSVWYRDMHGAQIRTMEP